MAHQPTTRNFRDSQEASHRRFIRDCIKKSGFTRAEREVVTALLNVWFYHKDQGVMHPGRKKLAKRARVAVKTVSRTLAMLRETGVLEPVSKLRGGWCNATRYRLDEMALVELCGFTFPTVADGVLVEQRRANLAGHSSANQGPILRDIVSPECPTVLPLPTTAQSVASVAKPIQGNGIPEAVNDNRTPTLKGGVK